MSGHSKWATTHRKKAIIDAKRGKIFTKLAKLVTIAARDGKSGDPSTNPSLRMAIENAKAASMPKDNIERAIQKGIGGGNAAAIEEITYEVYAPNGIAMLLECLTDNKNRTLGEIKALLNKSGGSLAGAGSVNYLFTKKGQIVLSKADNTLKGDDLEMAIIDSGAMDFEDEDEIYVVSCAFTDMHTVTTKLKETGINIESAEIVQEASTLIELPDDKKASIVSLIEKFEELDDISNVFTNLAL